jgi:seryl-tRNA synthetase
MIPKVVSDAGYTAVGLGVLAVQQVQTRRRETRTRVSSQLAASRQSLESAVDQVKARIEPLSARIEPLVEKLEPIAAKLEPVKARLEPVKARLEPVKAKLEAPVSAALGRLPHLPGPVGDLLTSGRERLRSALRSGTKGEQPPGRHADQGEAEATESPGTD